jgi:hypothetical protein
MHYGIRWVSLHLLNINYSIRVTSRSIDILLHYPILPLSMLVHTSGNLSYDNWTSTGCIYRGMCALIIRTVVHLPIDD